MATTRIEISSRTIVFIIAVLLFLWFLYAIRDVLLLLFVSLIFMAALNPLVTRFERRKIPRPIAILLIFIVIFFLLASLIAAIIPPLVDQSRSLVNQIPFALEQLGGLPIDQRVISDQLGPIPGNIARFVIGTFSNIIAILSLLVVTFYLLSERANLHRYFVFLFGKQEMEAKAEEFVNKFERQIGGWVRGQIFLMFFIGVLTYFGLQLLGISFALPLSILASLLEIVPNIGPTLAMMPAALIAATTSPVTALATVALYFLIQQLENSIVVPKVMQKAVGAKPLVTIIALMIGAKLSGVIGAVLAIPGYLILKLLVEEILASERFQKG